MDINYRGFSYPFAAAAPPRPSCSSQLLPPDGSRGPFERFDVRAEFVKPEGGVFQPS